jgi:hypothetical protein
VTDIVKLAQRLHRRIKWQEIPEEMTSADLIDILCDAIRMLYVISGRTFQYSDDMFTTTNPEDVGENEDDSEEEKDDGMFFADTLELDEQEWVLLEGEIAFYNMALSNVDDLQSYTTDAMAVTHGDKPYKNIKATVEDRQMKQAVVWTRMVRFNQLGVSG